RVGRPAYRHRRPSPCSAAVQPLQALETVAQEAGMSAPVMDSAKPEQRGVRAGTLSVIIITRDESRHIGACLATVAFADEIIVVDSGSRDNTRDIASARGARVVQTDDWPGFGPQKNRALDLATQDWVLTLDADERVTPELAAEIQRVLEQP